MNRTESSQHAMTSDRVILSVLRTVPDDLTEQLGTESQTQREPMVLRLPSQDGIRGRRMSVLQQVLEKLEPLRKVACIALMLGLMTSTLLAQGPDGTYVIGGDYSGSATPKNVPENPGVGGMGILGRIGHEAGETVGRRESITTFDMSPYMFFEETLLFGEARLFLVNSGRVGGSAGVGMRHFFMDKNTVGGLEFFYDRDDSRGGGVFEQFGVSTEIFTEWLDIRGNYYMPIGNKEQVIRTVFANGTEMFVNNNISFQTATTTANAMEGGDLMFTVPIPGEIAESVNLEASAGFYHYQARGTNIDHVYGYKLRGDIDLFDRLSHMFLEVTNDGVFDTNVVFGADINYRGDQESRPRIGKSQYNRISQWVRRNRHVVAKETTSLDAPQLAINPNTGSPYLVYHVRNNPTPPPINFPAPLGNGSIDMPFQFMNEAIDQAPFADIVFVHGNSVFDASTIANVNATAVLREDLLVLGEGVPLTIPVSSSVINEIPLPTATTGNVNRPLITNVTGPVVTLADNSRFSGFTISNVDGPVVVGTGVNGSILNEVNITTTTGATGNGIQLTNSTGGFSFENINISSTSGNAFQVIGGNANIVFEGTNAITDPNGYAVFVQDASGSVNMRGTSIVADGTISGTGNGGLGILIQGTPGNTSTANVTIGSASFTNTNPALASPAILVDNHSAGVSFLGDVSIDTNNGDAIEVRSLGATGSVNFQGATSISNRNGVGVLISSINEGPDPLVIGGTRSGIVTFQQDINITGVIAGNTDPGVLFASPSGQLSLVGNTLINGSGGTGFEVSNIANTGVTAGQVLSTGLITISNTAGNAFELVNVAKENFQVNTNGIAVNNRAQVGINVQNFSGTTRLNGMNVIDNQALTFASGVVVTDNIGDVGFGDTNVLNTLGALAVLVDSNVNPSTTDDSQVSFSRLSVDGIAALGVQMTNNENVSTGGGVLDITNGQAIDVVNNTRHSLIFESVSASNSVFGIRVLNSTGEFIITGGSLFDGGTISGMSSAGALFQNTQVADLAFQTYQANNIGIDANQMIQRVATPLPLGTVLPLPTNTGFVPFMRLDNMTISGSTNEGIRALNVSTFSLFNSSLSNNGIPTGNNQVQLSAGIDEIDVDLDGTDDAVNYIYTFDNNVISDPTGAGLGQDMILINTLATIGNGAQLDLFVTNNGSRPGGVGFIGNRIGASVINTQWVGDFNATFQNNVFLLNDVTNQTGVELNIDGVSNVLFDSSALSAQGTNAVGLDFAFSQQANVQISNNFQLDVDGNLVQGSGFLFTGVNSTAMTFTFDGTNNDVNIDSNLIQFAQTSVDADAIIFRRIFGPSNVNINTNEIDFAQFNTNNNNVFFFTNERGIIFQDVRGVISLNGSDDNILNIDLSNPFAIDFSIPVGTSTGSIIINGNPLP